MGKARAVMVQATMSNAGKSLLCAGLCRVFKQAGLRVAPFKSQNMALNSFITREGLEMGRAQAVQAEACGIEPEARMNPILLKPVSSMGSQVVVMGEVRGSLSAADYYESKHTLLPEIRAAYASLENEYDVLVIEGAGSPAEINLRRGDFVNMGMARLAQSPVLLVGDIDRGGVFAQLYGTLALLTPSERRMVKATVINKFRGDVELLRPGLAMLEACTHKPVAGVLPMLDVDIDDEDSLAPRLARAARDAALDIAVIRLPHLSNFTDFAALEATPGVGVRYVGAAGALGTPDLIVLPGTKSTLADLRFLREGGLEATIQKRVALGTPLLGVCGGYQMLGLRITDAENAEGGGTLAGMGLLPVTTAFAAQKRRTRVSARALTLGGALAPLSGALLEGYEIHMGKTELSPGASPFARLETGELDGCFCQNVYGTYLHGLFDTAACREAVLSALCAKKGVSLGQSALDWPAYRQRQYDALADAVRAHLNMSLIYDILEAGL